MTAFVFEKRKEQDQDQTNWECLVEGNFTAINAIKISQSLRDLINQDTKTIKLKVGARAELDITAINALVHTHRLASNSGIQFDLDLGQNPYAEALLIKTKSDRILMN